MSDEGVTQFVRDLPFYVFLLLLLEHGDDTHEIGNQFVLLIPFLDGSVVLGLKRIALMDFCGELQFQQDTFLPPGGQIGLQVNKLYIFDVHNILRGIGVWGFGKVKMCKICNIYKCFEVKITNEGAHPIDRVLAEFQKALGTQNFGVKACPSVNGRYRNIRWMLYWTFGITSFDFSFRQSVH